MASWVGDWEGGTVLGGWFCLWRVVLACIFAGCVCLPDVFTLPIDRESLIFVGFARIRRVILSVEGGTVACVLNREGGIVGNGRLGWGFGGWNGWVVD